MSMIGDFILVPFSQLDEYLRDSSLLEDRLEAALEMEEETEETDPAMFSVDKAWDALSYLLNGYPQDQLDRARPPLSWVIFGHQTLDPDQDLGYGPAQFLTVDEVKQVAEALSAVTRNDLEKHYDAGKMTAAKIYPGGWEEAEESMDWLYGHLVNLKAFYARAAESEMAVIAFLS